MSATLTFDDLTAAVLDAVRDTLRAEARRVSVARSGLPDMRGTLSAWLTVQCPHCGASLWLSELEVRHVGCPSGTWDFDASARVSTTIWTRPKVRVPASLREPADLPTLPATERDAGRLILTTLAAYPETTARERAYTDAERKRVVVAALRIAGEWARAEGVEAARLCVRYAAATFAARRGLHCYNCNTYGWNRRQATCPHCQRIIGYDPRNQTQSNWPLPLLEEDVLWRLATQTPLARTIGAPLPGLLPDAAYAPALPEPKQPKRRGAR